MLKDLERFLQQDRLMIMIVRLLYETDELIFDQKPTALHEWLYSYYQVLAHVSIYRNCHTQLYYEIKVHFQINWQLHLRNFSNTLQGFNHFDTSVAEILYTFITSGTRGSRAYFSFLQRSLIGYFQIFERRVARKRFHSKNY